MTMTPYNMNTTNNNITMTMSSYNMNTTNNNITMTMTPYNMNTTNNNITKLFLKKLTKTLTNTLTNTLTKTLTNTLTKTLTKTTTNTLTKTYLSNLLSSQDFKNSFPYTSLLCTNNINLMIENTHLILSINVTLRSPITNYQNTITFLSCINMFVPNTTNNSVNIFYSKEKQEAIIHFKNYKDYLPLLKSRYLSCFENIQSICLVDNSVLPIRKQTKIILLITVLVLVALIIFYMISYYNVHSFQYFSDIKKSNENYIDVDIFAFHTHRKNRVGYHHTNVSNG